MYAHVTQVRIHTHTHTHTHIHTLISLFCRQMSRLMHAWKSRDTGPYPDSAASLSNLQLTVRRRNTGSQASDILSLCYGWRQKARVQTSSRRRFVVSSGFCAFPESIMTDVQAVALVTPQQPAPTSCPIHDPLSILPFDAKESELILASLSQLKIQ